MTVDAYAQNGVDVYFTNSGTLTLSGALSAANTMTFASGQNLAGSATINSAVAFSGGNIVSGTATLNSTVSLGGALTVNGTLGGTAALDIGAGSTVNGSGKLNLPVSLDGGTLAGTFTVPNFTLTANGGTIGSASTDSITIPSSLTINSGTLTLTGSLTSTGGYVTVNSGGTLTGNGALNCDLKVANGATVTGNFSVTSNATSPSQAFEIDGSVTGNHSFTDLLVTGGVNVYGTVANPGWHRTGQTGSISGNNTFNLNSYFALFGTGATLSGNNAVTTPALYVEGGTLSGNNVITVVNLPPGGSGGGWTGTAPGVYIDDNVLGRQLHRRHRVGQLDRPRQPVRLLQRGDLPGHHHGAGHDSRG